MKLKSILFITLAVICNCMNAQVGINTNDPKATLDISFNKEFTGPQGVLIPRITLADLRLLEGQYGAEQNGMLIQVIGPSADITTNPRTDSSSTQNIYKPGFFRYDAESNLWIETEKESWNGLSTQQPATQNDIDIFKNGRIGIGTNSINETAQLDITSANKGLLIPRLTTISRDAIVDPANGLIIFNTTTRCLNYFDQTINKWLSMCGTYDPAQISIFNCDLPVGPNGEFKQGQILNTNNTYTLVINVAEVGTYDILIETGNGYSFSQNGIFTEVGFQNVVIKGQGVPVNFSDGNNVTVKLNGVLVNPDCELPKIPVIAASTQLTLQCSSTPAPQGIYYRGISTNSSNYIDIPVNVTNGGSITIETEIINGLYFSSGAIEVTTSTNSIRLFARGTPTLQDVYNFSITNNSTSCGFNVSVDSSAGTFQNPMVNCEAIKNERPNSDDGYYWLSGSNGQKYKTYCDMVNGGWTLIKSTSEKNYISANSNNSYTPIPSFQAINKVFSETGKFNEYDFSLSIADLNIIKNNAIDYKFTIKEKGHDTNPNATLDAIETSTVSINIDPWALENYYIIGIVGPYRPQSTPGTYFSNLHTMQGKVFGKNFSKSGTTSTYTFDNLTYVNDNGFYSSTFYIGYGNGGSGNPPSQEMVYTYPNGSEFAGKSFTFNAADLKDMFGHFGSASYNQLNHHFLACTSNGNSDFDGPSNCNGAWGNWRPHKLNAINNSTTDFHGKILQIWMK